MKFSMAIVAACSVTLLSSPAVAQSTAGTPIVGVPIGLEGDPGSVRIEGKTDARGSFTFSKLAPGRYTFYLADISILKAPVRVSLTVTDDNVPPRVGVTLVSEPIRPAKGGDRAYALDKNGRRLVVEIPKSASTSRGSGSGGQIIGVLVALLLPAP